MKLYYMLYLIFFSAAMGWCGTPYPGYWRKPHPDPPPQPDWLPALIGILAGIATGLAISLGMGNHDNTMIGLSAMASGRITSEIGNQIRNQVNK